MTPGSPPYTQNIPIQILERILYSLLNEITHHTCYFTISQKYIGQIPLPFNR